MTIQDRGVRIEDRGTEVPESSMDNEELHWVSNTQSSILDPVSLERVRWRCRRGLLELDIVLGRFIPHYPALSEQQKLEFDVLLDMPDTQLWDMISGKQPAQHDGQSALLAMINSA